MHRLGIRRYLGDPLLQNRQYMLCYHGFMNGKHIIFVERGGNSPPSNLGLFFATWNDLTDERVLDLIERMDWHAMEAVSVDKAWQKQNHLLLLTPTNILIRQGSRRVLDLALPRIIDQIICADDRMSTDAITRWLIHQGTLATCIRCGDLSSLQIILKHPGLTKGQLDRAAPIHAAMQQAYRHLDSNQYDDPAWQRLFNPFRALADSLHLKPIVIRGMLTCLLKHARPLVSCAKTGRPKAIWVRSMHENIRDHLLTMACENHHFSLIDHLFEHKPAPRLTLRHLNLLTHDSIHDNSDDLSPTRFLQAVERLDNQYLVRPGSNEHQESEVIMVTRICRYLERRLNHSETGDRAQWTQVVNAWMRWGALRVDEMKAVSNAAALVLQCALSLLSRVGGQTSHCSNPCPATPAELVTLIGLGEDPTGPLMTSRLSDCHKRGCSLDQSLLDEVISQANNASVIIKRAGWKTDIDAGLHRGHLLIALDMMNPGLVDAGLIESHLDDLDPLSEGQRQQAIALLYEHRLKGRLAGPTTQKKSTIRL